MRYAKLFFGVLLLATAPAVAQPETKLDTSEASAVEYTRLDELVFDRANVLTGEAAQIAFRLVRIESVTSGESIEGIEVDIRRKDQKTVGGSIGLAAVGSLVGANTNIAYRQIRKSGYIFLRPADVNRLGDYLGEVVANLGAPPDQYKIWKLSVQKGFEMGMRYDPAKREAQSSQERPRWAFIITAEGASYQLDYSEGYDIIQTLAKWETRLGS